VRVLRIDAFAACRPDDLKGSDILVATGLPDPALISACPWLRAIVIVADQIPDAVIAQLTAHGLLVESVGTERDERESRIADAVAALRQRFVALDAISERWEGT